MLNQIIIVGRLVSDPQTTENKEEKEAIITLAVPRSYKNSNGIYEVDFIPIKLFNGTTQATEYCKLGDVIGVRGRVEKLNQEDNLKIIADKITFLSTQKGKSEEA